MKILYLTVLIAVSLTVVASDLSTKAHDVFEMTGLHGRMRDRNFNRAIKKIRGYDEFVPQAYRFRRPVSELNLKASDENFRLLALDMSNNNQFVLVMSMKNDNKKRGTLIAIRPKDEFAGSTDYLEIVCDPAEDYLSVFASIDGDKMAYNFETAGVKVGVEDPVWTNLTLHVSMETVTLFHGCRYVGQFTLQRSIFQVFDYNQKALLLATGYGKGQRDYRGSLERIRFYVGATLSEILRQEEGCSDRDLAPTNNGASKSRQTSEARAPTVSSAFPPNNDNMMCGIPCSIWSDFFHRRRAEPAIGKPATSITFPETEPKSQSCWDQSHRYEHGEQWSRDECQSCNCSNGRVTCMVAECPPLHCIDVIKMEGECCAVCSETADPYSEWSDWTPCSVTCGLGQEQRGRACDGVHFECTLTTKESKTCVRTPCDVKVKMDGRWSPWAPWNGCSVTCGEGHSTRVRLCNAPSPQLGGKECVGESREVTTCFEPHCPIDGEWGPYSAFTPCTASCGNGTKTRNRQCDNPAPKYGGNPCVGEPKETTHCYERPCPIDGRWSLWSKYGPCSATCGTGQKTRNRECNNPEPKYGGKQCEGQRSDVKDCRGIECPIDGKWGPYTPFTRCSATCGQGFRKRARVCNNPAPLHGGKPCAGDSGQIESCIEKSCPINTCRKHPCYRGVTCTPFDDGTFVCGSCPEGMQGNGIKCIDIDECSLVPDACFHYEDKHRCQNQHGGYICLPCPEGYKGTRPSGVGVEYATEHKQQCKISNPCTDGSNPCPGNSECIYLDPTMSPPFMCKCHPGFSACPSCKGLVCSEDSDLDGWPDQEASCERENATIKCHMDNCPTLPNSGQENADKDDEGDACDLDDDDDGVQDARDNCPLSFNPTQYDSDDDRVGDVCDNCPFLRNPGQIDTDGDGLGDDCDPDLDGDDILNGEDNCKYVSNKEQKDRDSDGVGDECDNCPKVENRDQGDIDDDLVGDACDTDRDRDMDGWQDNRDNCPFIANSAQTDHDQDGIGDSCDPDDDDDGILDEEDNCRLIFNPDQLDTDGNGRGDVCEHDFDGDGVPDFEDACYANAKIQKTDFSVFDRVKLDPSGTAQIDPNWVIRHKGKEIIQTVNCDPGLAISRDTFEGVDFDGTFFVNTGNDDDYAGFVFGYQSSSRFYVLMWKQVSQSYWKSYPSHAMGMAGLQLKVVESKTGPGEELRNALWHTGDTAGQVRTLWQDPTSQGWNNHNAYRWRLNHRPSTGEIRVVMHKGKDLLVDSGRIVDKTYAGGRMGMFIFSQEMVFYSDMEYKCNDAPIEY